MKKKILYLAAMILVGGWIAIYAAHLLLFPFDYTDGSVDRIWSIQLAKTMQDLSIAQNNTIVAVMKDSVESINLKTGEVIWTAQLPAMSNPYPALVRNEVAFLLASNSLLALNAHDGTVLWQQACDCSYSKILDATDIYVLVNYPSNNLDTYDAISGKLLWSLPAGRGFIDAYIDGDTVYEIDDDIKAIDARSGKLLWETPLEIRGNSILSNGKLFYEGGNPSLSNDTYVAAFDVHQHTELWRKDLDIQGFSDFLVNEENLYVSDQNHIYALSVENGHLIWVANSFSPTNMAIVKNKVFALGEFSRTIREFQISSGKSNAVLQMDLPQLLRVPRQDMIATGDIFLFSKDNNIYAYAYEE